MKEKKMNLEEELKNGQINFNLEEVLKEMDDLVGKILNALDKEGIDAKDPKTLTAMFKLGLVGAEVIGIPENDIHIAVHLEFCKKEECPIHKSIEGLGESFSFSTKPEDMN